MGTVNDFFIFMVAENGLQIFMNDEQNKITIIQDRLNDYEKHLVHLYCGEVYGVKHIVFRH